MIKPFDARIGKKLPKRITSNMRFFGYYIGNETLLLPDKTDMSVVYEPSNALGELYMVELFGLYNADFSYITQKDKKSVIPTSLAYIQSLHNKIALELPLDSDQIKNGKDWRYAIVRFMLDLGNRNLETLPLIGIKKDYCLDVIDYGNSMEMITAIFCNTLRMDKQFNVINENWVRHRTSQYIRLFIDHSYIESPRLKEWETMLWL